MKVSNNQNFIFSNDCIIVGRGASASTCELMSTTCMSLIGFYIRPIDEERLQAPTHAGCRSMSIISHPLKWGPKI